VDGGRAIGSRKLLGASERQERDRAIVEAFRRDPTLTLQQVGNRFRITRQRVSEILIEYQGIDGSERIHARRRAKQLKAANEQARNAVACVVCGSPVLRRARTGKKRTCSPECTALWNHIRYAIDQEEWEKHRLSTARWVLAHEDDLPPSRVAYARRVLAGEVVPGRRWSIPGSQVEAMRKAFPAIPPPAGSSRSSGSASREGKG
jgi:hypothetical protein